MWTKQDSGSYRYAKNSHRATLYADASTPDKYRCELNDTDSKRESELKTFRADSLQHAKWKALLLLQEYIEDEMTRLRKTSLAIVNDRKELED